ncbi:MAG TPA: TAXI family TRAP transporter solute-binding subunit [Oxalicibacterium sp.]|uniref:TAXI family TRAP transporter solute-binding subunit n=1 Tax=Oxalicibacterium sp. TaxID=2766525 RepID=UPI002C136739|nr:TAXI family TRAP transporter solute-binding subunit [Oxalicibacterium sp.]HWU96955.1 TAXI family TRAP transporter solute-binding subunit [Oxalicibacterium sp.]
MPKKFKFTRFTSFSLRDLLIMIAPMAVLIVAAGYFAYKLINPFPPSQVTISTGQENSAYASFGKRYAETLDKYGIKVTLRPSQGALENLQRLKDEDTDVDVAFVQSSSMEQGDAEKYGLVSLGTLFNEPIWLFYRANLDINRLTQLKGLRVNVGAEGSGIPKLLRDLLAANGLKDSAVHLSTLDDKPAADALLEGKIDAAVFSSAPNSSVIQKLLRAPAVDLFDFSQAEAYTRRFPYLSQVTLPRGLINLGRDQPPRDIHLIALTTTLLAREDLHPALVNLFAQAAVNIHGTAGWFRKRGEFPNAAATDIPVVPAAVKFYRDGTPFLQRYLPFWVANFFERMWIVIVALGALLIPLSRVVPPLYVWKVRSRIYRWYGELRTVEQAIEEVAPDKRKEVYPAQLRRLEELDDKVNHISIPLSFADELYRLRISINLVRKRILWLSQEKPAMV